MFLDLPESRMFLEGGKPLGSSGCGFFFEAILRSSTRELDTALNCAYCFLVFFFLGRGWLRKEHEGKPPRRYHTTPSLVPSLVHSRGSIQKHSHRLLASGASNSAQRPVSTNQGAPIKSDQRSRSPRGRAPPPNVAKDQELHALPRFFTWN